MQAVELEVTAIADRFMGGTGDLKDVTIQYPATFDVSTLTDDVTDALSLNELPGANWPARPSPMRIRTCWRRSTKRLRPTSLPGILWPWPGTNRAGLAETRWRWLGLMGGWRHER